MSEMTHYEQQLLRSENRHYRERIAELEAEVEGLERFRDLRIRHDDEMEARTSQLAQAQARIDRALELLESLEKKSHQMWASIGPLDIRAIRAALTGEGE